MKWAGDSLSAESRTHHHVIKLIPVRLSPPQEEPEQSQDNQQTNDTSNDSTNNCTSVWILLATRFLETGDILVLLALDPLDAPLETTWEEETTVDPSELVFVTTLLAISHTRL